MNKKRDYCVVLFFSVTIFQLGCSMKYHPYSGNLAFVSTNNIPDYARIEYWAAHPDKRDPSDSIPKPFSVLHDKTTDVFFVHPTTFTQDSTKQFSNARIDDPYINKKTDFSSILYQASVFNASCRVFAPRYRQAHISMYYAKDTAKAMKAFELAYSDVKSAFLHYLHNYNEGRPIIIASHSQGTTHTKRLLKELFDGKELSKQLVASYILGIPVERGNYKELKPCMDISSTGCIISWRTFREGYMNEYSSDKNNNIIVTNPLSWKTDTTLVYNKVSRNSLLYSYNKNYRSIRRSRIVGDMLWVNKPRFPGAIFYNTKNYHAGDFNLFYGDIRADVHRRIMEYKRNESN